jgi:hypothetical protein
MKSEVVWSTAGRKGDVWHEHSQHLVKNDGGRSKYFQGTAGDCVTRSIAIATGIDYMEVYNAMFEGIEYVKKKGRSKYAKRLRNRKSGAKGTTPRNGVHKSIYKKYLESIGWKWVPTMTIGSGCMVRLRGDELPKGTIIVRVSKHLVTMIDGVIHDTYDCTRGGKRCVYGYFIKEK